MADILTVSVSALVGLISGFVGALGKSFIERRVNIDEGLRAKRAEVYGELWKLTGILPQYPKNDALTYTELKEHSEALREWYFQKGGGLYLSRTSQTIYLEFQKTINKMITKEKGNMDKIVESEDYELARAAGSTLRSKLTDDLHSRSASPFRESGRRSAKN